MHAKEARLRTHHCPHHLRRRISLGSVFFFISLSLRVRAKKKTWCVNTLRRSPFILSVFCCIQEMILLPLRGALYCIHKATHHWHPPIATQAKWVIVSPIVTSHRRRERHKHNDSVQLLLTLSPVSINTATGTYPCQTGGCEFECGTSLSARIILPKFNIKKCLFR